jgi:hypothetical protein
MVTGSDHARLKQSVFGKGYGLVAIASATVAAASGAAPTATAAESTTAAAAAESTSAAAPTAPTAAVAATTAAAATAAATFFAGAGFVDGEGSASMFLAVEGFDGCLGFGIAGHFDESEPLGATGIAIVDDLRRGDLAVLSEHLFEL